MSCNYVSTVRGNINKNNIWENTRQKHIGGLNIDDRIKLYFMHALIVMCMCWRWAWKHTCLTAVFVVITFLRISGCYTNERDVGLCSGK